MYNFLILKCRGKSDLGLCMTLVLAKRMRLRSADFKQILRSNTFLNQKSALCVRILFTSTEVMNRPRSDFSTIDIVNTYQFRTEKKMLALGVCFPQPCSSAGRRFASSRSRLNYFEPLRSFYKDEFNEMLCKLDSTEYACPFEPRPTLPGGYWNRKFLNSI